MAVSVEDEMMLEYFVIIGLLVVVYLLYRHSVALEGRVSELVSRKQSQSTRYGQIFEQMVPFSKDFPFDPKQFRFLGTPVDGVVFEDDGVYFCEIKLNGSTLSARQKNIKKLVDDKKVYWKEIRG